MNLRSNDCGDESGSDSLPMRLMAKAADEPLTTGALMVMSLAAVTIAANVMVMQSGKHPAPLFSTRPFKEIVDQVPMGTALPAEKPVGSVSPQVLRPSPSMELVRDIQALLSEKGLYSGSIDGIFGPVTGEAIRTFERDTGLTVTGEPSAGLLAHLQLSPAVRSEPQLVSSGTIDFPSDPALARSAKLQEVLNRLGYGPIEVDGLVGSQTASAIRRFELDRGLPLTGTFTDEVIAEMIKIGGLVSR